MPDEAPLLNAVGDLVLTDPRAMEALADPLRLTLFDHLRRDGPLTEAALAARTHQEETAVASHLGELARFGLVERVTDGGEAGWTSAAKGIYFEIPDDPDGQAAARRLSSVMLLNYADLPRRWATDEEPELDLEWARAAGLFNARVAMTPDELRGLQESLERLLEPLKTRSPEAVPSDAVQVRVPAYFMPEPS